MDGGLPTDRGRGEKGGKLADMTVARGRVLIPQHANHHPTRGTGQRARATQPAHQHQVRVAGFRKAPVALHLPMKQREQRRDDDQFGGSDPDGAIGSLFGHTPSSPAM